MLTHPRGVLILTTSPGSLATRMTDMATRAPAKLKAGEFIVEINGNAVRTHEDASREIQSSGDTISIEVQDLKGNRRNLVGRF